MSTYQEISKFKDSLLAKMKREGKSENTTISYLNTYNQFLKWIKENDNISLNDFMETDIYSFLDYKESILQKQGELSVYTVNATIIHLRKLFSYIERNSRDGYDFSKVFEDIKTKTPERKPKGLSENDLLKLLNYLERSKEDAKFLSYRNSLIIKFMLLGGLRVSEVLTIKRDMIELDENNHIFKIYFKGKGEKTRTSYIKEDDIADEIEFLGNTELPYATSINKKPMLRGQINKMVNSLYRKLDIKGSGVHILRHTFAKGLLGQGVDITIVQKILGHSSIQTTSIYTNPNEQTIINQLTREKNEQK